MRLSELLKSMDWKGEAPPFDPEVAGVTCDSRKVNPGDLFVAIRAGRRTGTNTRPPPSRRGPAAPSPKSRWGLPRSL